MREYKQQEAVQHKCPNCGAFLKYDPQSGQLSCEHCGSLIGFEKSSAVQERDFEELVTFQYYAESDVTCYRCANCGAVTVAPRTVLSTHCPYCTSPVVIQDTSGSVVKPDTVVPFELTAQQAAEQIANWSKHKLYAPGKFRKRTGADSVKGVFIPAWTFDAQTTTHYNGTVGYRRTRTVRRNGKTFTETYVEWRHISGVIDYAFDDIFVRANDNISESYFRKLMPFPQSKYKVYDEEYLAGFLADHYTLEPTEAFNQAKVKMQTKIRESILAQHHADEEGMLNMDMKIDSKSFKYVLLPVYIASTKYGKKVYNQYVSGIYDAKKQTKVCGKAPVSPWKVLATVLAGIGAVVGLILLARHAGENANWEWNFEAAMAVVNGLLPK